MRAVDSDASGLPSMLLCDIASLSRLSITIFSAQAPKSRLTEQEPRLQVGLYHSNHYAIGKNSPNYPGLFSCDLVDDCFSSTASNPSPITLKKGSHTKSMRAGLTH